MKLLWYILLFLCWISPVAQNQTAVEIPLQFQGIRIWEKSRKIEAQGVVNMNADMVELFATTPTGKKHESVVVVECNPFLLYNALGIIQLNPGGGGEHVGDSAPIYGDKVFIYAEWKENGQLRRERAENLIWDKKHNRPMPQTHWVFTGSRLLKNRVTGELMLMASKEGSLVATYYDPFAILNNPLSERTDDTVYYANSALVPPKGTPITVVFTADPIQPTAQ
jgi:hypothetical protein